MGTLGGNLPAEEATQPQPRWPRRRIVTALAALCFTVFFLAGTGIYLLLAGMQDKGSSNTTHGQEALLLEPDDRINVLLMGVDAARPHNDSFVASRSDTMMLVSIDPLTREVGIISLPRDTRVNIPGRSRMEKLAHAFAYGGAERAMATVAGFLEMPVHYYVALDFRGFVEIVDLLGGVDLDVEKNMNYEDPVQDLYIHLRAGPQHLDGETALKYVRYRNDSDIRRIERQQKFMEVLTDKMFRVGTLWKLPDLVEQLTTNVRTNMEVKTMLKLASLAAGLERDKITMAMVPGDFGEVEEGGRLISYWLPDRAATSQTVDRVIRGIDREANSRLRVLVLNGNGRPGAAAAMQQSLEQMGYNVVGTGNATDQDHKHTLVENLSGDESVGRVMVRNISHFLEDQAPLYRVVKESDQGRGKGRKPDPDDDGTEPEPQPDFIVTVGLDFEQP